jgi:predicted ATPase
VAESPRIDELLSSPEAGLAHGLISNLDSVDVERYAVVGQYTRFDDQTRNALKDARQRIVAGLAQPGRKRENHLLWAAPGSGKTYLVQQVAESLGDSVEYQEINLAKCTEAEFRENLAVMERAEKPVLCLIDEADAKPDANWPYELLLPFLDAAVDRRKPWVFVLAGSSGLTREDMKRGIAGRPKGADLLSRIPVENEYDVAGFGIGDRVLVALSQFGFAAAAIGHDVREVEKLGLLYVALVPHLANARQLREFAARAVERMLPGDDRLRYDNLFAPGDPLNKQFWSLAQSAYSGLEGSYVTLAGRALDARPAATPLGAPEPQQAEASPASGPLIQSESPREPAGLDPSTLERTRLVGRREEQALLRRLLDEAAAGKGGLVMIAGEAGVGKTRIAEEIAEQARAEGMFTGTGHCYEMEGAPPFIPFIEFIDQMVRGLSPANLRRALGDAAPEVAQLAPKLRQVLPPLTPSAELPPEQARYYMFSGVCDFWEEHAQTQPTLLVLEDFHWADESSCLLLEHLAQRLGNMAMLVICTYRGTEIDRGHPLTRTLEHLSRRSATHRLALGPFAKSDVEALLLALSGKQPPSELVALVFSETEGVPFFIEEVYRHLAEQNLLFDAHGEWRSEVALGEVEVPDSVRLVIGRRLDQVDAITRRVLTQAAAVGRAFSYDFLKALVVEDEDAVLNAVDEAERSYLLRASEGVEIAYSFSHELVRQTLLAEVSAPRRQRLHARVAETTERLYADSLDEHVADLAYHLIHAGQPERAVDYLSRAGEDAASRYASAEALGYFQRALDLSVTPASRHRILTARAKLLLSLFRGKDAAPDLEELLEVARRRVDREAELAALLDLGSAYYTIAIDDPSAARKSRESLERAYELAKALDDKASMARSLIARRHLADFWPEYLEELREQLQEARRLSDEVGDEDLILASRLAALRLLAEESTEAALEEAEAVRDALRERHSLVDLNAQLFNLMWGYYNLGRFVDCVATCDEGFDVAGRIGVPPVQYASIKGMALTELGRFDEAWASLQHEIADEEHPLGRANRDAGIALYLMAVMAFQQAETAAREVIASGERLVRPWVIRLGRLALARSLVAQGKLVAETAEAAQKSLEAESGSPADPIDATFVAEALLATGRNAESIDVVESILMDAGSGSSSPQTFLGRPLQRLTALEIKARALTALGRPAEALEAIEPACSSAAQLNCRRLLWRTLATRAAAQLAAGDRGAAAESYREAASGLRSMAETIPDPEHRQGFLSNPSVENVLSAAEAGI